MAQVITFQDKEQFVLNTYRRHDHKHAAALIRSDFRDEWADVVEILYSFRFGKLDIISPGGSISTATSRLHAAFSGRGWETREFRTQTTVEEFVHAGKDAIKVAEHVIADSATHEVDFCKSRIVVEIEWNSKEQTYDRDLNTMRYLFDLNLISAGIVITRDTVRKGTPMAELLSSLTTSSKMGGTTTHFFHLERKLAQGRSGGCPVLVLAITRELYQEETGQ